MKGFRTLGVNLGAIAGAPWVAEAVQHLGMIPDGQEVTAAVVLMAVVNTGLRLITSGPVGGGGGLLAGWLTNTVLKELRRRREKSKSDTTQEKS